MKARRDDVDNIPFELADAEALKPRATDDLSNLPRKAGEPLN